MPAWKKLARQYWVDGVLVGALFAFGLALRLPYLYLVPRWADEMIEPTLALQIARGEHSPFVGVIAYMGPFYLDLLALIGKVWLNPFVPRALVAGLSTLTLVSTYILGRALFSRAAGLIAGALMATLSTDIVVESHIAYGNSLTPFFAMLMILFLLWARQRQSAWRLAVMPIVRCAMSNSIPPYPAICARPETLF